MSEIRVNTIVAAEGTSAPNLPYGIQVPTGMGITGAGGLNITGVCTAGIVTATNLYGTLNGNSTGLSGTPNISCGTIAGSTGTFSGAVNVDDTTDSTSSTSGSLIVDGGLGVAKNVYIGAGLSVAGTLTYEDVTNVDSVGLITAKSGVNISGGELKVGSAVTVSGVGVVTFIGAGGIGVTITPSTGKVQATYIEGPLTGNVTGNVTGNLNGTVNTGSQTNITSVGTLGNLTVSGDVLFDNGEDAGKDVRWDVSEDALHFNDSVYAHFGSDSDLKVWHDGSNGYVRNTTGSFLVEAKSGENAIVAVPDEEVKLYFNGNEKIRTTDGGVSITGIATFSDGLHSNGLLRERANVVANKLSAGTNVEMIYGNIHYYTTNETTTATPNIRYNASYSLNSKMTIGEAVTVTIIYKPNNAGYYAQVTVDGNAVTEEWNGGSAPSSANSGGYDVLTHTLVKTADATFLCLSNVQNYA